jgi:hypothetical protein
MKVSYGEGVASHTGPASCGGARESVPEALTGERAGWVLSHEIVNVRSADGVRPPQGHTGRIAIARFVRAPRGLRPQARTEASHTEAGRPQVRPRSIGVRAVNPKGERRR